MTLGQEMTQPSEYILKLEIPIYESALCLAYSKITVLLREAFPGFESIEEWAEVAEYERLQSFIAAGSVEKDVGEGMLKQLRTKQISHGPTFRFSIEAADGLPRIEGSHYRWGITFKRSSPFSESDDSSIRAFLNSLEVGQVKSWDQSGPNEAE